MPKRKKKEMSELEIRRHQVAEYAGMLGRWGEKTGNIPPAECETPQEWIMKRFAEHLKELQA